MNTPTEREREGACENTDRELWRERFGDFYANSLHVTASSGIGINVGGRVIVKPLADWHALALAALASPQTPPAGWMPIESAPISGRGERPAWFLAFNGHHIGVCARWGDEGYGETIADETDEVVTPEPTHWMPLPAPPNAEPVSREPSEREQLAAHCDALHRWLSGGNALAAAPMGLTPADYARVAVLLREA